MTLTEGCYCGALRYETVGKDSDARALPVPHLSTSGEQPHRTSGYASH